MTSECERARVQWRPEIEELGERIAEQASHVDAAVHRLLTDIRTFDEAAGWAHQGARSCAQWLVWRLGWGQGTAREHVRVASKLAELPLIDDALRRAEISYCKTRAITRVATPQTEATLLEYARYSTGSQLEEICRKWQTVLRHDDDTRPKDDAERRHIRRYDTADGMVKVVATLHPEEAAIVLAAIERIAKERCRERAGDEGTEPAGTDMNMAAEAAAAVQSDAHVPAEAAGAITTGHAEAAVPSGAHVPAEAAGGVTTGHAEAAVPVARGAAERATGFDRADALVAIASEVLRGTSRERSPIEVVVSVSAEALRHAPPIRQAAVHDPADPPDRSGRSDLPELPDPSAVACFLDGTCISSHAARRLACDCGVVGVIEDERGIPLSVGRRTRTIPGAMKRALLRRDRTCRFPGCRTRTFLEGHHIDHWAEGGETALSNMLCLCTHHHRFVHEYGYEIRTAPHGEVEFVDDRGRPVPAHPPPANPARRGLETIRHQNRELDVTRGAPPLAWGEDKVDYALAIDGLVRAELARA
jgi:hypothetical protein